MHTAETLMMKAEYYNEKIKNDPNSQRLVKDQADHWALIVALKNQIDYTDGKKLACLMSLLRGDALESVNACDNIDQNYQPVLNQLMQELGDKNALIDEHISRASTSASTTQRHPPQVPAAQALAAGANPAGRGRGGFGSGCREEAALPVPPEMQIIQQQDIP